MKTQTTITLTFDEVSEAVQHNVEHVTDVPPSLPKFESIKFFDDGGALLIFEGE